MDRRYFVAAQSGLLLLAAALLPGCGSPAAKFVRYDTYTHLVERQSEGRLKGPQLAEADEVLAAMFGTPDDPLVPSLEGTDTAAVLDLVKLQMAAGPVGSDESGRARGLYREHCAHCHGITGDGNGPTAAFLNPYPRDYRPGKFKFKSTPIGYKPTHDDLKKIVLEGIPGTAMPSFALLTDLEVESLVGYVKYLSIRGEVERFILKKSADLNTEADPSARLVSLVPEKATEEQKENLDQIKAQAATIFGRWSDAPNASVEIPPRPKMSSEELAESRKRGRTLFYGTIGNCAKCHGDSALGDGVLTDYDDWAGEFIGKGPDQLQLRDEFVSVGMPYPRNIRPRNLRLGIYRGGMRPIDIYWRIRNGIEGVPMPGAPMKPEGDANAKGLTPDDIWDIVNYVQSLPYEAISDPNDATARALAQERLSQ